MAKDKNASELPDFSTFVDEQIGFAPYWEPETGKQFYARLILKDERDPDFVRYIFENLGADLECGQGAKDENGEVTESVTVKRGEQFSVSEYCQMAETFSQYLNMGFQVPMLVTSVKKVKGGQGTVWTWKIQLPPEWKSKVTEARAQFAAARANKAMSA